MPTSDEECKTELPSEIIVGPLVMCTPLVANLLGRNIKRRLQQLDTFTQIATVIPQTSKQPQQNPSRITSQASIQSEKPCLQTITPAASETLLSDIDTTAISAVDSSDTSSIEVALISNKEETDCRTSLPDQGDCEIVSHGEHDKTNDFFSIAPLTVLETDVAFFVCLL